MEILNQNVISDTHTISFDRVHPTPILTSLWLYRMGQDFQGHIKKSKRLNSSNLQYFLGLSFKVVFLNHKYQNKQISGVP